MTGPERDRFDERIEQELAGIVPGEGIVGEVDPWRVPLGRIAAGLALTGITFNMLYLQYLLPALGIVLQYLGFRALRRSGPAFRLAWALSAVRLVWFAAFTALEATPWAPEGALVYALGLTAMGIQVVQLLALRAGLREVCRRAETPQQGDPLRSAVIWQLVVIVLAFSPLSQSWLAFLPMFLAFVLIIRSLVRLSGSLGGAGYCFVDAPVCVSSRVMKWGYLLACLLLVLGASVCVNHPRLDAQPQPAQGEAEARQVLAALGMPEEVLADLSDEHVRALEGALYVYAQQDVMSFYSSTTTEVQKANTEADRLGSYIIYIELPDSRMAVLNYFDWRQGGAYWGDAVKLGWQDTYEHLTGQIGGALLYEKDGQVYTAPIPRLNNGVVMTTDWFFGTRSDSQISGTVSYPFGAQNQRGYVLYILQLRDPGIIRGNTWITYRHRLHPFSLPYQTPAELTSGWTDNTLQQHLGLFEARGQAG